MRHLAPRFQLLFVAVTLLSVYYPVLFAPFNSIDDLKMVNSLLNVASIDLKQLFFPGGSGQYYRPLLYLTYLFDTFVWGILASFMHLENILLHVVSAVLLFFITRLVVQVQRFNGPWLPLVTALLFGLHPIATESVNWVSGRTDVLACMFVLASLLLFLISQQGGHFWLFGWTGALLLLAGCLCKETALFILPALLLWCLLPPRDLPTQAPTRLRVSLFASYFLAGVGYLVMRWLALSSGDKIVKTAGNATASTGESFTLLDFLRVMSKTSGFYFKKLLLPLPLNFGIIEISPYYFWLGLLVCIGLVYCLYWRTLVAYLLMAAFCLIFPALILPLLKITWTPVAERYAYIASAPFVLAVLLLFSQYIRPKLSSNIVTITSSLLLTVAGVATFQRNMMWQDNFTLFQDTVQKSPNFPAAKNELAIALTKLGRTDEAYRILLANGGDDFQPSSLNKARVYLKQGRLDKAREIVLKCLENYKDPSSLELLNTINEARIKQSQHDAQRQILQEMLTSLQMLQRMTNDPFYYYRIGLVQLRLGNNNAAKHAFTKAWQGSPQNSHYREAAKKLAERL